MNRDVYIIDGVRTPIGKYCGSLSSVRPDDLAAHVISSLIKKFPDLETNQIDDVIFGCANQAGEDNRNVARMASLIAGLPWSVPGETVNRLCASGMSAVVNAGRAISNGDGEIYVAGGVESMSRAPYVMGKAESAFSRSQEIYDTTLGWRFINNKIAELYGTDSMGQTAENVARRRNISRTEQDEYAFRSQIKASKSRESGRFTKEIAPIEITIKRDKILFSEDEYIRQDTSKEKLSELKPAFAVDGTVTAGNSSGLNDGACAILLASESAMEKFNLTPMAKIVGSQFAGVEPKFMGIGPVPATRKLLEKTGLSLSQMDVIEINEAFASQVIACLRELDISVTDERVNPNGGAIALGHPLGMSGARLILTAAYELREKNKKYALCTMCVGVGQGAAIIIESV